MVIRELVNKSVYGTIGYIKSVEDLNMLEQYIVYNLSVLKEFKQILVATNYSESELESLNELLWLKYFPNTIFLHSKKNRGHNHGNADLDNMIFDYCKINNIRWLCKSANDIIFTSDLLDKEIDKADFYYLNGIGYGGIEKYNFDFTKVIDEDFYPQTNFYFIDTGKVDYLNDKQYLDETYDYITSLSNYNGKIWEYIDGWSCEGFLKQCVERNKLLKFHLIPQEKYLSLLQIVKDFNIHDCSHKNIMINGVCHYSYPEQQVVEI